MSGTRQRAILCLTCARRVRHGAAQSRPRWPGTTESYSSYSSHSTAHARARAFRCAVVGSGPAGFYAAYRMLQKIPDARIDMYEALPVPFGLVRFGVAPDHPEVKNCIDKFNEVATHPSFTFIGNVPLGTSPSSLPLSALTPHYDALLFAYGASRDRKLDLPGERLDGVYSARGFVGWYNGLPEYADLAPKLDSSEEAVIIGQGNVALDVARTLLSPLERLRSTDMTDNALEALSKSRVKRVRVVGRRGPMQAPYTIKEIRELMQLPGVSFSPADRDVFPADLKKLPRQLSRIAQVIVKGSPVAQAEARKEWELVYMQSPTAFEEDSSQPGSLGGVSFEEMEFRKDPSSVALDDLDGIRGLSVQRKSSGKRQTLDTKLAFRSVGYQSEPISGFEDIGVPFDARMGIIPNDLYGRVISPDRGPGELAAGHVPGMYCAGWVKRGPTGVIASTMDDAFISADVVGRDWADSVPFLDSSGQQKAGWGAVKTEVAKRGIRAVSWSDWEALDAEERRRGKESGKQREKIRSVHDMLKILD